MTDLKKVISGISEYLKAKLYPSLDTASRAKISATLLVASFNPKTALTLLLSTVVPSTPPEQIIETAKAFGILDENLNADCEKLISVAKTYIAELGKFDVNLYGIEFELKEQNIEDLSHYLR